MQLQEEGDGVNFTRLQTFVAVVDAGTISQAGKLLGMSQPAVSQHIKTLESEFGVQLFHRTPDGVQLTREGAIVYDHTRKILDEYAGLLAEIRSAEGGSSGRLRIGACSIPGAYLLPEIIFRFRNANPNAEVIMHAGDSRSILEWVSDGRVDVGAVDLVDKDDGLVYVPFYREPLLLIGPRHHPRTQGAVVEPEDLLRVPFVSRPASSGTRRAVEEGLRGWGLQYDRLQVVTELGSAEEVVAAVERGMGVSLVSLHVAMPAIELKRICTIPVAAKPIVRDFLLVMRPCATSSPIVSAFCRLCESPAGRWAAAVPAEEADGLGEAPA